MPEDRTHRADSLFWPKRPTEQTHRVQILQPWTVGNVGFASRHILHVMCVDQKNLKSPGFQDLKKWNPIPSRRFHRYRFDVAAFQPSRCGMEVFGEGRETAYRLRITILWHGDVNPRRPYIHTGGVRI